MPTMFLFNKNNAAPQRQSSIDSLVTNPSASASPATSQAWLAQYPDVPSGDMPSSDQDRHLSKRSSVFKLRSRSNTAASTASSVSVSPTTVTRDPSSRTSKDLRHLSGANFMDLPGTKRSRFARVKRGKRLSDAVSPNPDMDEVDDEYATSRRSSVLQKIRKNTNPSEGSIHSLKHRISRPFDFQHLTHTDRDHVGSQDEATENDLLAESEQWPVRAGQASRRATNASRTDTLHFDNFSSENLSRATSRTAYGRGFASPPQSPEPSTGQYPNPESSPESSRRTIRPMRSIDSFSQPGIFTRAHRPTPSGASSPRAPSRQVTHFADDSSPEETRRPMPRRRSNRDSGVWDRFAPLTTPPPESTLATIADEHDYFGHAVTTPDDTAIHALSPAFTPDLEDVAEEPERFTSPRPAPLPPMASPPLRSPLSEAFSPRATRSRMNRGASIYSSPNKTAPHRDSISRPMSQMSDTLGPSCFPRRSSIRRPSIAQVRRRSNTWRVIEDSWEDDIDYAYDHAIEADCDFDWEHASDDGIYEDHDRTPEQDQYRFPSPPPANKHRRSQSFTSDASPTLNLNLFSNSFRPSLLVPSHMAVPDLDPTALPASTVDTRLPTPSDFITSIQASPFAGKESESFIHSPSLLVPSEYKENAREEMYQGLLADYEGSDRHFPILDTTPHNPSMPSSTRSSRIRSSKRSSYDSSLMTASSGQGSGSWGSPIRRSASSSGSIPELVHSRRKDAIERLSDQMAAFPSFGEDEEDDDKEDDDTTPPGRPGLNPTFFAEDEEDVLPPNAQPRFSNQVESEVKNSLELVRQGSVRSQASSAAPKAQHKHAASEGAAKLLAAPSLASPALASPASTPELKAPLKKKTRERARASSSPYLSLFPAPPKHLASPMGSPVLPTIPQKP